MTLNEKPDNRYSVATSQMKKSARYDPEVNMKIDYLMDELYEDDN